MQYIKDTTMVPKGKTTNEELFVRITYDNLVDKFDCSNISPMMFFLSTNYTHIKDKNSEGAKWASIVTPVNSLLTLLTDAEQYEILIHFDEIMKLIKSEFEIINKEYSLNKIVQLMKSIGSILLDMEKKTNLCTKITEYIDKDIYIGDFSQAGSNPQDRAAVTYKAEDAKELIVIATLSKILFPIFGLLLVNIKSYADRIEKAKKATTIKTKKIDGEDLRLKKEVYVSIILDQVLEYRYKEVNEKLDAYVADYVERKYNDISVLKKVILDETPDAMAKHYTSGTFHTGITTNNLIMLTKANLLVKAFVNGNITDNTKSHIMGYVHKSVSEMITKKLGERDKFPVLRRTDPSKKADQETPQLEIDSITSKDSFDILGSIEVEIPKVAFSTVTDLNMEELYQKTLNVHLFSGVHPSYINKLCLCTFFGRKLGGGTSILYLSNQRYAELLSAFQMYLIDMNFFELIHMVCAKPVGVKHEMTNMDMVISGKLRTPVYKQCMVKYNHVKNIFNETVEALVNEVTKTEFVYNTPSCIYNHLDLPNANGEPMYYTLNLMNQIFYLLSLEY